MVCDLLYETDLPVLIRRCTWRERGLDLNSAYLLLRGAPASTLLSKCRAERKRSSRGGLALHVAIPATRRPDLRGLMHITSSKQHPSHDLHDLLCSETLN
jgi:hypothetical protein